MWRHALAWGAAALGAAGAGLAVERGWPTPAAERAVEHAYGPHPRHRIDLYPAPGGTRRPLVLWVHGGGWAAGDKADGGGAKPRRFAPLGLVWASANHRLLPEASVEGQLDDLARAIAWVRDNAVALGVDPDRLILAGHSSGAHLAAMLASDPRWLARADVPLAAVRGVLLVDSAALDIAPLMRSGLPGMFPHHDRAFGEDAARHRALSPTTHLAAPNVARWLILHEDRSASGAAQSAALALGLGSAGADARVIAVPNTDHGRINTELGRASDPAAPAIERWLIETLGV